MDNRLGPHLNSLRREWNGSGATPDPRVAARYLCNGQAVPSPVLDALSREIASHLDLSSRDVLLDAGCGSGVHFRNLAPLVARAIGVDLSLPMLSHLSTAASIVNADIGRLPFREETFDKALCFGVLQYALDESHAETLVAELLRVTRPGGRVYLGGVVNAETAGEWEKQQRANRHATGRSWLGYPLRVFRKRSPSHRRTLLLAPEFFSRFLGGCRGLILRPMGYPELQYHLRFDILLTKEGKGTAIQ